MQTVDQNNQQINWGILILTVFVTCFGSSMLYGYNMAVINLPADNIKCFLNISSLKVPCNEAFDKISSTRNISLFVNFTRNHINANFLYGLTGAIFVIGGGIGAICTYWVADRIGRRNGLLCNHSFVIIGALLNGITVMTGTPALLFFGRFFIGINSGITIGLASMYLTEIAPTQYRGTFGACHQLAVTFGIVFSYLFTLTHTLNSEILWPVACACTAIPAIISLFVLPFCPESPAFIHLKRSNDENVELREEASTSQTQSQFKFSQLFTQRDLRLPVMIACLIQVMQQLSGINAVISYSSSMLETAGIPEIFGQYCVLGIGFLNVVCTLLSLLLLDKYGRRPVLLWPSVVLAISLLFLTVTINLVNRPGYLSVYHQKIVGGISVFFIMTYTIGFALGLGPVPALIVAEIFRPEARGAAYSLSQSIQWVMSILVLCIYPWMNEAIGGYSFVPFLIVVIIAWIFFFRYMPETKDRTVDEMGRDLTFHTPNRVHPTFDQVIKSTENVQNINTTIL